LNPAAEHLVDEGTSLYRQGDILHAAERYRSALELAPDHPRANFNLGVILQGSKHLEEAVTHFRRALQFRPDWPAALVNLGNALKDQGDLDGARVHYSRALEIDPTDMPALNNLGSIAFLHKDYSEAQERYRAALALGSEEARLGLANTLRDMGKVEEAIVLYDAILAHNPEVADAHYESAIAMEMAGNAMVARRRYSQAIERAQDHVPAMHRLAALLMSFGNNEGAEPLYKRILELTPGDFIARNNLGKIAVDSGNNTAGRAILERLREEAPDFAPAAWNLAQVELRAQRFVEAWAAYESRLLVSPLDADLAPDLPLLASVEEARGKRVGVRAEQGIGDQVLFTTLLPELLALETELVVELNPKLVPSYRRCFPAISWIEQVPKTAPPFDGCDYQVVLGSLPGKFRPSVESFNRQPASLLSPEPERQPSFAQQVEEGEINIGI
jgi:Flp pilus assembly protein TadD